MAKDTTDNLGVVTRTLIVEDTVPPIITLCGPPLVLDVEAGTQYKDEYCTPVTNDCTPLTTEGTCNGRSGCKWTPEEAVCYLQSHSCFGKKETECVAPTCRWCDNGQHTDDIVDGEISTRFPALVTVDNPVNTLTGQNLKRFTIT